MPSRIFRFGSALFLLMAGPVLLHAQTGTTRDSSRSTSSSASSSRSSLAKGPLPDPALLDGSALEAEKHPEHGMLGEFELPGDENSKSDKVGATGEQPPPPGGGGGAPDQKDQSKNSQSGGGGASDESAQASASGGGGSQGSQSKQGGGKGGKAGAKGSNSNAEGTQVGELAGESSGEAGSSSAASAKPAQVALGDTAMQIKSQGAAPGVIGAQQQQVVGKDVPQQYDAKTPGGGKQSGAGRGNQGVEKGRVMPSGI